MSLETELNKGYATSPAAGTEASLNAGYGDVSSSPASQRETDLNAGYDSSAGGGPFVSLYHWVTGDDRQTEVSQKYPLVDASPEFSGWSMGAAKAIGGLFKNPSANIAMALATSPEQKIAIIKSAFPELKDDSFWKDEKGNLGVTLPSGRYMLDKPGITTVDAANAVIAGLELELTGGPAKGLASRLGGEKVAQVGAKLLSGAAADLLNQGIVSAGGGGPVSGEQAMVSGLINAVIPGGGEARPAKDAIIKGAEDIAPTSGESLRKVANTAARKPTQSNVSELASLVDADPDILAAAERLGFSPDEMLPSHYSNNDNMRRLVGILASRQGSGLAEQEGALINKMSDTVKDFITSNGGSLDSGEVSAAFKRGMDASRDDLEGQEKELYKQLDEAISPVEPIKATNTTDYLDQEATKRGGGLEQLEGEEKKVAEYFSGEKGKATYHGLNRWRRKVGLAYGKAEGNRTPEELQLAELYHVVRADVKDVAERHGLGDVFEQAKEKGATRFSMDDVARKLLGKDENDALMPVVTSALKKLDSGQVGDFIRVMNLIPEEYRQQALITGIGEMFSQGSKAADVLHLPGAVNWLRDVKGNSQAWSELVKHLPESTVNQLNDIYTMFSGVRRGRQYFEANTGTKVRDFEALLNQAGGVPGLMAKHPAITKGLEQAARYTATAGGHSLGGAIGSMGANAALTSILNRLKGNVAPELDRLLATPEFSRLATSLEAGGEKAASAAKRGSEEEKSFAGTQAFKSFYKKAPQAFKDLISRKGLAKAIYDEIQADKRRKALADNKEPTS